MFGSLIHLDIVLMQGSSYVSNFILLLVSIQFSLHHLLKMVSFLHDIFLAALLDIYIWIFDFCSNGYMSAFVPVSYFYYCVSVMYLKIWNCNPFSIVLFAQDCFLLLKVFCGSIWNLR